MSLRAERLLSLPESRAEQKARISAKLRITDKVIESIGSDILKRLEPFDRKVQQQRGLTKSLARKLVK